MSTCPVEDLLTLAARLEAAGPEPGSPEHRLATAVHAYISGTVRTMDEALDLVGSRGIGSARARFHLRRRGEYLGAALRLLPAASDYARCKILKREIDTFEACVWPRWRDLEEPPETASDVRVLLFKARRIGPLPATAAGLRKATRAQTG